MVDGKENQDLAELGEAETPVNLGSRLAGDRDEERGTWPLLVSVRRC